jgi:hypothetical protein
MAACAHASVFSWITSFGVPETITSDHGLQFISNVLSNGAVERFHCCLEHALFARTAMATWAEEIPWILLGLHAKLREDTGLSPAEAVFGAPIVWLNEFLMTQFFKKSLDAPAFSLPRHLSLQLSSEFPADLLSVRLVWVRHGGMVPSLHHLYDGPYIFLRRGPCAFSL